MPILDFLAFLGLEIFSVSPLWMLVDFYKMVKIA